jgi:hypothetical protein
MPYVITKTDGTLLTTIADGTIDSTTSLSLPGPNYLGYGQKLDENFVYLLENFASTSPPGGTNLLGQLWFNKSTSTLNVFTSQGYLPVNGSTISGNQPSVYRPTDTWYNNTTGQFYYNDGTNWNLIGPVYTKSQGISGAIPVLLNDANVSNTTHKVVQLVYGGTVLAIFNNDAAFVPSPAIPGFTKINPGMTLSSYAVGSTINANVIGGVIGDITGNLVGTSVTVISLTGNLTGTVTGNLVGTTVSATNITGSLVGNVSAISAAITNLSSANLLVSGGSLTGLSQLSGTNGVVTNLSSANITVTGGNILALTKAVANQATITNLTSTNAGITNITIANVQATSGNVINLTTISGTNGSILNLTSSNLNATGGNVNNLVTLSATNGIVTNLTTSNLSATGGTANNLSVLSAITGNIVNLSSSNVNVTGGFIGNRGSSPSTVTIQSVTVNTSSLIKSTATTPTYSDISANIATAQFVHNVLPYGCIVMWAGSVASIPTGWQLCDGSNGTPDLRNQFIIGAGSSYSPGSSGGSSLVTLSTSNLPSHTHNFSLSGNTDFAGSHVHNISLSDPGHHHTYQQTYTFVYSYWAGGTGSTVGLTPANTTNSTTGITASMNYAPDHTHPINLSGTTSTSGSGSSFSVLPPYYALCYIQKMTGFGVILQ